MFRRWVIWVGGPAVVVAVLLLGGPARAQDYRGGGGGSAGAGGASAGRSARALEVILKASGVPNRNGRLAWPPAFHALGARLRMEQVDAQLELAVEQLTAGGVNPALLDEIRGSVESLRQLVLADRVRRFSLTRAAYEDAERFLRKLENAPHVLSVSAPVAQGETGGR